MFEEISYSENILSGKSYVLSVAIDKYQNQEVGKDLKNTVFDAENILEALDKYKIEKPVTTLYNENATYDNLIDTIDDLKDKITEDDNLIVIWGGHGKIKDEDGYLIFHDSTTSSSRWLSYRDLIRILEKVNARHLILLINSCYSGKIFEETRGDETISSSIQDMKSPSRWCLVSGRNEVSDGRKGEGSPFANAIKDFLTENEELAVPVRDITQYVKFHIKQQGKNQEPFDGVFDNQRHKNGIFHFQLKEDENAVWNEINEEPSIEGYSMFITKFPKSLKRTEADQKLHKLQKHQKQLITYLKYTTQTLSQLTSDLNEGNSLFKLLQEDYERYENLLNKLTIKDKVQKHWTKIKNEVDFLKWTEFIAEYEASPHVELIQNYVERAKEYRDRLKEKEEAENYWKEITLKLKNQHDLSKILGLYHLYIYKHPHSTWAREARNQITIIEVFQKAKKLYLDNKNITLLYQFQDKYPNHKFSERAKRLTEKFEHEQKKQEDKTRLEEIKSENYIQRLREFSIDENVNEEIRKEAQNYFEIVNNAFNQKLEKAKNSNNISLFHQLFTNYKDDVRVEEAKIEFEERLIKRYDKSIQDVYIEKSVEPLDDYITEYIAYEKYETSKILDAKKQLNSFKNEIELFQILITNDDTTEDEYKKYLTDYPNAIFKEEVNERLEKLKVSEEEEILRKRCLENQEIEDLEEYIIKFREYEDYLEINILYQKKKAEYEANDLIEKATQFFNLDEREKALKVIKTFQANFLEHVEFKKIQNFKEILELRNKEDHDLEIIKSTDDRSKQKFLCYQFLSNQKYTRRNVEVEKILIPAPVLSYSQPKIIEKEEIVEQPNIQTKFPDLFYWIIGVALVTVIGILVMFLLLYQKLS